MAARPRREHPVRTLVLLGVLVAALFGSLIAGSRFTEDASMTPKLALDLEGGTQLILTPRASDGSEITQEDIDQAIAIMRQRVDASGVAEAEITNQGGSNIVVALPGTPDDETIELVGQSAQLRFRPVLVVGGAGPIDPQALEEQQQNPSGQPSEEPTEEDTGPPPTREEIEQAARQAADSDQNGELSDEPAQEPANSSDQAWITEQLSYDYFTLDCTDPANRTGGGRDPVDSPIVACSQQGTEKYILGPTSLTGSNIVSATSGQSVNQQGYPTGEWGVDLRLDDSGSEVFGQLSERLVSMQQPQNQFGIVLDGLVISAPVMNAAIYDGRARIDGANFTPESASTLANQLNFGSLPIDFEIQSQEQISATLGTEQLSRGILAGLIGAGLVVVYMLWQYRGLGLLSVASLVLAGVITYGLIALMSWLVGYRLSLPGVVGLIVAVGITADSFIVYFERIRDEVREGRTLAAAIEHGWPRARRTILASDAVNLTAAVVLYLLAVGGVQGFAFTLGLVTLVDVVVVFGFTHAVMLLLVRTKFFGQGHKLSGLEPESLGATSFTYRGRGRFGRPEAPRAATREPAEERELVGARSVRTGTSSVDRDRPAGDTAPADPASKQPDSAESDSAGSDRPAPESGADEGSAADQPARAPLPPPVDEDGRRLTIAERRARQRKQEAEAARTGGTDEKDGER
ncbi:protein translocase subunit SecD [Georgenia alba]|uniref:Protein translocase subunit SecD n=1 Tax=Georgenia alba TaxID=2233858 RepID=A0ABW2QA83_9MICO